MCRIITALAAGLLLLAGGTTALSGQNSANSDGSSTAFPAAWSDSGQPDSPDAPNVSFSYYTVLGSQLQPRVSTTAFVYASNGCIYETAGDLRFAFPLLLPHGSVVKYLRIYYNDTDAADLTAWITKYDPGVSNLDLTSVQSIGSAGYGTALSAVLTETFASGENYTLTVGPGVFGTTNQICGLRVAYYAP